MRRYAVRLFKSQYQPLDIPATVSVKHGDFVLVRTEKGEEVTQAYYVNSAIAKAWENKEPEALPLVRVMSKRDLEEYEILKKENETAFLKCKELVRNRGLNMNLINANYTFDRHKITFYYTAPARVDFRELLKDLTQEFRRVRIDLRHIGVRDETAMLKGCGLCGREFCCCSFLKNFDSINIKLAKDQGMPISPSKISGTCGRLLCCLNYEYQTYLEAAKDMPPIGSGVMTPQGIGRVCALHFLNNKVAVKLEDGKIKDYTKEEIEMIDDDVNNIDISGTNVFQDMVDDANEDMSHLEDKE
ncbi:MAG: stage 0 sporulation protein [bacterium]|nr:stage 0 sporulation protein [bacterium]